MNTISLCMIVKNEEKYIGNCLKSICDLVDEIIIVDTGSTDKTKEICKQFTDKIYDFKWVNDFAKARNFSFEKATSDYIMWLDADDILIEKDRIKFKSLKDNLNNIQEDFISMEYNYSFDKYGNPQLTLRRNRLIKKSINPKWIGFVHEVIDLNVNDAFKSDVVVTHTRSHSNTDRNLQIFEERRRAGEVFSTRDTLYYAKELFYNNKYYFAINEFKKFLSCDDIWIEDKIDALIKMSECYRGLENEKLKQSFKDSGKNLLDRRREPLFETFKLTYPRAEALYRIANSYLEEERFYEAIFYLESIFSAPYPKNCAGFLNSEMWNFLPHLQLCYAYYCIGDVNKSIYHHNECMKLRPEHESVKSNDLYFSKMKTTN